MKPYITTYNIACGIDNNYVEHLAAMLNSLFINNPLINIHIYVLSLDISEDNKKKLVEFVSPKKQILSFIDVAIDQLKSYPIFEDGYISPATYLRLFIPSLLPQNINKVLYLDTDIIVNTNVEELFNTDISNAYLAAVEDAPNESIIIPKNVDRTYFNAGVLLLNLQLLREFNFLDKAFSFIQENKDKLYYHDQDVLNALLSNRIKTLPIKWNMLDCFYNKPPKIHKRYIQELQKTNKKNCIIHFSGKIKPWHSISIHPLTNIYNKYKPKILFTSREQDESHLFIGLPRYRKFFVQLHLPKWLQRELDNIICRLWRLLKL